MSDCVLLHIRNDAPRAGQGVRAVIQPRGSSMEGILPVAVMFS